MFARGKEKDMLLLVVVPGALVALGYYLGATGFCVRWIEGSGGVPGIAVAALTFAIAAAAAVARFFGEPSTARVFLSPALVGLAAPAAFEAAAVAGVVDRCSCSAYASRYFLAGGICLAAAAALGLAAGVRALRGRLHPAPAT